LSELYGKSGRERAAYFVCAVGLAQQGRAKAVVTGRVHGEILEAPRGAHGFGYDPVFYVSALDKGYAEISAEEKNALSHRGQAFRKLMAFLSCDTLTVQS
jgi:XTP/dITP diphosphohydrolase